MKIKAVVATNQEQDRRFSDRALEAMASDSIGLPVWQNFFSGELGHITGAKLEVVDGPALRVVCEAELIDTDMPISGLSISCPAFLVAQSYRILKESVFMWT